MYTPFHTPAEATAAIIVHAVQTGASFGPPRASAFALLGVSLAMIASWIFVLYRTIPSQSIAQVLHPPDAR